MLLLRDVLCCKWFRSIFFKVLLKKIFVIELNHLTVENANLHLRTKHYF